MCLISLDREKNRLFFYILFVRITSLEPDISPFFYMAVDHWCLSLRVEKRCQPQAIEARKGVSMDTLGLRNEVCTKIFLVFCMHWHCILTKTCCSSV